MQRFTFCLHSLLVLFLIFSFNSSFSQSTESPIKWGSVSKSELTQSSYEQFPDAAAVVLADYGTISINYNFQLVCTRHTRIKILKPEALDEANVRIPYYSKDNYYSCKSVKAQSFSLVDGSVVKSKVEKSAIFEKQESEYISSKNFAIPNVNVGSVIEYTYTLRSEHIAFLDDWVFHSHLPTLYSGLTISNLPGNLDFQFMMEGDALIRKYRSVKGPISHWNLKNVPPIRDEPAVANPLSYANKMRFQLAGYYINSTSSNGYSSQNTSSYRKLLSDWPQIVKEQLWGDPQFNHPFTHKKQFKDDILALIDGISSEKEKMTRIYTYCQNYFQWNGTHSLIFSREDSKKIHQGMQLHSGPFNLYLTAMLEEAGLTAIPVLISTRKHGKVYQDSRFLQQFNHIITYVEAAGKSYFLDASIANQPYQFLPVKDMNELGLVALKKAPQWVKLPTPRQNTTLVQYKIDLSNTQQTTYQVTAQYKGVYQVEQRNKLSQTEQEAYIKSEFSDLEEHCELDSFRIKEATTTSKPLTIGASFSCANEEKEEDPDILYVPLFSQIAITTNPFQDEVRYYPVETPFSKSLVTSVSIILPENYVVEELPENKRIDLDHKMGHFDYQVTLEAGKVNVSTTLFLKQGKIKPKDYKNLKSFFGEAIAQMEAQLVLKKKTK